MYTYCGHRMPWHISFSKSHATVQCHDDYNTPQGLHFVMTFLAFDIKSTSVALTQWNEHELFTRPFTLAYLSIGKEYTFGETEIQLHIAIMVYNKISLKYSPGALLNLKIYDGPGTLSPHIDARNKSHVALSSYQSFVKYSVRHNDIGSEYTNANNHSYINSTLLNWTSGFKYSNWLYNGGILFLQRCSSSGHGSSLYVQGTYSRCWLKHYHGIITIRQMIFTGPTMLRHSPSSRSPTCQYGGLFVVRKNLRSHHSHNHITICSNVTDKKILPINSSSRDELVFVGYIVGVIFITFPGYSGGFIDLTITKDDECFGSNVALSRGPYCNNYFNFWTDKANRRIDKSVTHCTDVWLLNNIGIFESSPFENCTYILDHAQLGFPVVAYQMILYSSVIYQSDYFADLNTKHLFYINAEVEVLKDIQARFASEIVTFRVSLSSQNEHFFNLSSRTLFNFNFYGLDPFPTFSIRVKFIENRICSPGDMLYSIARRYSYSSNIIYTIANISDVYLSPRYQYEELSSFFFIYNGYNLGTCRALVIGHKCSHLITNYQIIQVHYRPHTSLVSPHKIDISMKKTPNCSTHCSLNVGILEYIDDNNIRIIRHHKWRGIYRVTWQVIAAKFQGFSVTINSTCATCTQLCDVAIALGLPQTSSKMFNPNNIHSNNLVDILPHLQLMIRKKARNASNIYARYLDHLRWFSRRVFGKGRGLSFHEFQLVLTTLSVPSQGIISN